MVSKDQTAWFIASSLMTQSVLDPMFVISISYVSVALNFAMALGGSRLVYIILSLLRLKHKTNYKPNSILTYRHKEKLKAHQQQPWLPFPSNTHPENPLTTLWTTDH